MRVAASLPTKELLWKAVSSPRQFTANIGKRGCLNVVHVKTEGALKIDDAAPVEREHSTWDSARAVGNGGRFERLKKLYEEGRLDDAIQFAVCLQKEGISISRDIIYCFLQECIKKKDLTAGRAVQHLMVGSESEFNILLKEHVVRMFASCGSLVEANEEFCKLPKPSLYAWNAIVSAHALFGNNEKALQLFHAMLQDGEVPDKVTFLYVLKACSATQSTACGRLVHELILKSGLESNMVIGNTLISMYSKCRSVEEARDVFENLPIQDTVSWGAMITGYAHHGHGSSALELFERMQEEGALPNMVVFLSSVKACASIIAIEKGSQIHHQLIDNGLESNVVIASTLIDMYGKCGSLEEACRVFSRLQNRNVVSWSAMIAGYVQNGHHEPALDLFENMLQEGILPDKFVFSCVLKACHSLEQGKQIHSQIFNSGLKSDVVVGNSLIDMYAKCGNLKQAHMVFDEIQTRDIALWGSIIGAYIQYGHGLPALVLFERMQQMGLKADNVIFSSILKACGSVGTLEHGMFLHDKIVKRDLTSDMIIGNALVDMYSKCGCLEEALKVFDDLPNRDVVSWGAMIAGYAEHGHGLHALDFFGKMQAEGIEADEITFVSTLKACAITGSVGQGRIIHDEIINRGLQSDLIIGNALVDMYAKSGSLEEARSVFDKLPNRVVVCWGTMIAGYAKYGQTTSTIELLEKMQEEGIKPDNITFLCILKACGNIGAVQQGRLIHEQVTKSELQNDVVIGNTLINMYTKCGSLEEARKVFDELPTRNVVSWGAMITGYAQNGYYIPAFGLWVKMQQEGMTPSRVTFLCMLKTSASIGAIQQGRLIHDQIIASEFDADLLICNTLVDMYAKFWGLEEACNLFHRVLNPDTVTWSAIIAGYAAHGDYKVAKQYLEDMQRQGFKPNNEIFTSLLAACNQSGLVEEGRKCFKSFTEDHGIMPSLEHYSCMVDLLSHAGLLSEATNFLQAMPCEPDAVLWTTLLTSCKEYGNLVQGRFCFDQLVQLNPNDASAYVLMSKIYADAHMWEDVVKIQELRKSLGALKKPAGAWIEIKNEVYEFIVGDDSHTISDEIYVKLKRFLWSMKKVGYVPQVDSIMEPFVAENKNDALCGLHNEKLGVCVNEHIQELNYMNRRSACAC